MPLSFHSRRVDTITVVTCTGRLIADESAALQQHLDEVLRWGPDLLLHVGAVEFVDSSGLGLLTRYLARTRNAGGGVKLCAVPNQLREVLRITKLGTVLESHDSEREAIAAFYQRGAATAAPLSFATDILCVEPSADLLVYVGEVLRQAGYRVTTAAHWPDALILLTVKQPKVVVMSAALQAAETHTAATFHARAAARPVVVLPADFARQDPGVSGAWLLGQVRAILGAA
jgi:anti-sigma B factor antagonist